MNDFYLPPGLRVDLWANLPEPSTQEMEALVWSMQSFIECPMFARLCASSCKIQTKSLPSGFTRGERKTVTKLTSSVNGVGAAVTGRQWDGEGLEPGPGAVGDFSSWCQETAVGVKTSMRRGSQKRWGPDLVI